jgi:general stress protein YciG
MCVEARPLQVLRRAGLLGPGFQGVRIMSTNNFERPRAPSDRPKSNRGFASMDLAKQREIASKGGKAAHAQGRAHEFTADEARAAGRKGGEVVSRDRAHMAAIGRAGGQARGRNRSTNPPPPTAMAASAMDGATLPASPAE